MSDYIEINIKSAQTNRMITQAPIVSENQMGQIIDCYAEELGIVVNGNETFRNERNSKSSDLDVCTAEELGLQDGDTLIIGVATDKHSNNEFTITITHRVTGTTFEKAHIRPSDTLEDICHMYGHDIGLNIDEQKKKFVNKRTNAQTADSSMTAAAFELIDGDVLSISDDNPVA